MIKQSKLFLIIAICISVLTLSGCSVNRTSDSMSLSYESQTRQPKQLQSTSLWESEHWHEKRFTLDWQLTDQEKRIAKNFSRTVHSNLNRNDFYLHYLLSKLNEENVPLEMAAIPLVESGLNPHAYHGGAHGAWQFIRATGRSLGLEKQDHYDGIYDFFASTDAGIKYLKKLYNDLGDWEFVVIAYNQGEYGVKKAIERAKKKGTKNISLDTVRVARQSRAYLSRVKAFADILKQPDFYNIKLPNIKNRPPFRKVEIAGRVNSLKKVAELSGANIDLIKKLNSGYRTDKINPNRALYIPLKHAKVLEKALEEKDSGKEKL
ncbi:lytic transglycosylase domain-containing protein [Succinivibrio sp.]|uniref:lytic transglycosylase domain-containing protein n=1 Tax=Succinivibrio sp. TaxID=2053619 RepID=UPI00258F610F|nr:lytic transglycosylase domain-containing protein [Succinivibrio sp.]MDD6205998.1 transglycosylase SLT domain-containing protein [Succinivibrio sp.]